jgi:glycosyltransferase involved in cell wall biosynthesis
MNKPIIYDFDDAIFLPVSSRQNKFVEIFKNSNKIASIIKKSKHVIAGNKYLCDFALRYNNSVSIIPTPIDTHRYYLRKEKSFSDKVVVGWMGSVTTLDFLNSMKNTFIILTKKFPNLIIKIVGGEFFIDGISNIISKPWSLNEEISDLMSFDIGIMTMPDNEWTKGKCAFKAIQYMNMGIPCVCSPVGMNKEVINEGVNGFFASTEDEWIEKLSMLIENPGLREKLGIVGRKTIEERYSLNINSPKFLEVLKRVYEQRV